MDDQIHYSRKSTTGIYLITNTLNQKTYVGKSIDITNRWASHLNKRARVAFDPSARLHMYFSMRKHGIDKFTFAILEECKTDELDARELYWITQLKPEYNTLLKGDKNELQKDKSM